MTVRIGNPWKLAISLPVHRFRLSTKAAFSQCTIRPDQADSAPQPATSKYSHTKEEQGDGSQGQGRQGRGVVIPAFALFAVGAPLGWYLKKQHDERSRMPTAEPGEFVKYKLIGKDSVSSTCAIFRLKPAAKVTIDLDNPALERAITSVEFKQPQLQIARSYTCLPQEKGQDMDELRFLIRREQKGEVSNFLHKLPVGAEIEIRGLHAEYVLPSDLQSAIFLVGGTGIVPAMQAADVLAEQSEMHILWASRKREDCIGGYNDTAPASQRQSRWFRSVTNTSVSGPDILHADKGPLVMMLERLRMQGRAASNDAPKPLVDYCVDEEGTFLHADQVKNALFALPRNGQDGKKIIFVSGPEGFINHWAGSKQWANGREVQGPLRGVLSTLDLRGWEVVKL